MQIGDILTHNGRRYVVHGFDPEGITPRMIYVEDAVTGARITLPFERIRSTGRRETRHLRLVRKPRPDE